MQSTSCCRHIYVPYYIAHKERWIFSPKFPPRAQSFTRNLNFLKQTPSHIDTCSVLQANPHFLHFSIIHDNFCCLLAGCILVGIAAFVCAGSLQEIKAAVTPVAPLACHSSDGDVPLKGHFVRREQEIGNL